VTERKRKRSISPPTNAVYSTEVETSDGNDVGDFAELSEIGKIEYFSCPRCGKAIAEKARLEHSDRHLAEDLALEERRNARLEQDGSSSSTMAVRPENKRRQSVRGKGKIEKGPDSITDKLYDEWKAGRHVVVFTGLTEADLDGVDKGRARAEAKSPSFGQIDFSRRSNELIIKLPSPIQRHTRDYIVGYIMSNLADMNLDQIVSNSSCMSFRTCQRIKEPCQSIWLKETESDDMIEFPCLVFETGFAEARPKRDILWWLNVSDERVRMAISIVHDDNKKNPDYEEAIDVTTWIRSNGIGLLRPPKEVNRVKIIRSGKHIEVQGEDMIIPLEKVIGRPANPGERDIILDREVFEEMATLVFGLPNEEPEIKSET
ncbi:hypothetical protein KEM54_003745, partial [Ascosphaera aggregata]